MYLTQSYVTNKAIGKRSYEQVETFGQAGFNASVIQAVVPSHTNIPVNVTVVTGRLNSGSGEQGLNINGMPAFSALTASKQEQTSTNGRQISPEVPLTLINQHSLMLAYNLGIIRMSETAKEILSMQVSGNICNGTKPSSWSFTDKFAFAGFVSSTDPSRANRKDTLEAVGEQTRSIAVAGAAMLRNIYATSKDLYSGMQLFIIGKPMPCEKIIKSPTGETVKEQLLSFTLYGISNGYFRYVPFYNGMLEKQPIMYPSNEQLEVSDRRAAYDRDSSLSIDKEMVARCKFTVVNFVNYPGNDQRTKFIPEFSTYANHVPGVTPSELVVKNATTPIVYPLKSNAFVRRVGIVTTKFCPKTDNSSIKESLYNAMALNSARFIEAVIVS